MKKVKKYVSMLNPFQNREDIPTPVFVAKKLLAFWFLYLLVGCIAGEILQGRVEPRGNRHPADPPG